jgi:hypothetical protein
MKNIESTTPSMLVCVKNSNNQQFKNLSAFTLAEMMVVLLIVSVTLACVSPAITTKMKADQNSLQTSPWKWVQQGTGKNLDTYFGIGSRQIAHIGQNLRGNNDNAKLVINNSSFSNMISFKKDNDITGNIRFENAGIMFGSFADNSSNIGPNSVVIGLNNRDTQGNDTVIGNHSTAQDNSVAIGYRASSTGESVAVGSSVSASDDAVAIGYATGASSDAVAIGQSASATGDMSLAFGSMSTASGEHSIAIGGDLTVVGNDAIAIGNGIKATYDNAIIIGNAQVRGINGLAIGPNANATANSITIGSGATTRKLFDIAIGLNAMGNSTTDNGGSPTDSSPNTIIGDNVAIGRFAMYAGRSASNNTVIGSYAGYSNQTGNYNTAIGTYSLTGSETGHGNTALGYSACRYVKGSNKTCIGALSGPASNDNLASSTNSDKVIFLGDSDTTVYIPGNLFIGKDTVFGADSASKGNGNPYRVYLKAGNKGYDSSWVYLGTDDYKGADDNFYRVNPITVGPFTINSGDTLDDTASHSDTTNTTSSDRRLKYVGKENNDGLAKLRQIKVFNYTFKKDPQKTPRVGVMAQDLQKIFPHAVKKGADGFLTIRMEDMFYAVINAIKELDTRVSRLEKENKELKLRLEKLEAKVK